ncbi:MAG TPA: hypothetical protein VLT89_03120 [Usitatibacter sp.]|nr:hypothetical protein [Usitatibacter sp.]
MALLTIVALAVSALLKQPSEEEDVTIRRCQADVRATMTEAVFTQVEKEHPELRPGERDRIAWERLAEMVRQKCGSTKQ